MAAFVLVHGAWGGGWGWKRVAPLLRTHGHEVFIPTLTGLGERVHLANPDISKVVSSVPSGLSRTTATAGCYRSTSHPYHDLAVSRLPPVPAPPRWCASSARVSRASMVATARFNPRATVQVTSPSRFPGS